MSTLRDEDFSDSSHLSFHLQQMRRLDEAARMDYLLTLVENKTHIWADHKVVTRGDTWMDVNLCLKCALMQISSGRYPTARNGFKHEFFPDLYKRKTLLPMNPICVRKEPPCIVSRRSVLHPDRVRTTTDALEFLGQCART